MGEVEDEEEMTPTSAAIERLNRFVEVAKASLDERHGRILGTTLGTWSRYHRFLQTILYRYDRVATEFKKYAATLNDLSRRGPDERTGERTKEEHEAIEKAPELTHHLHLEIESFYLFSKILLDRMADSFGYLFSVEWRDWGSTHAQLEKRFEGLVKGRGFRCAPPDILKLIVEARVRIIDYRTSIIEHPDEPRYQYATSWQDAARPSLLPFVLFPTAGDVEERQKPSEDPFLLFAFLEKYLAAIVGWGSSKRTSAGVRCHAADDPAHVAR